MRDHELMYFSKILNVRDVTKGITKIWVYLFCMAYDKELYSSIHIYVIIN